MPPKARNGFTQHAAPGAAPCSSRTCAIGRRSNAHSAAPQLNGFASFRGFLPGALSNACPSGPGRPSRIAREGQASNKARPQLPVALWRSQATMCRSPAVRASGDGERRLLRPANWNYRPRPGIRTSPKPPLSTGVFREFRCHEAAVRDLTTPAIC